jgi:AraC-like DNA-binding protein
MKNNLQLKDALHDFDKYDVELNAVRSFIEAAVARDWSCVQSKDDTFRQAVCMDNFVKRVGLSATTLKKFFREKFGVTIGQYITQRRVQYALRALQLPTALNEREVAAAVGLSHEAALAQMFHDNGLEPPANSYYTSRPTSIIPILQSEQKLSRQIILTQTFVGDYSEKEIQQDDLWKQIADIVADKYAAFLNLEGYVGIAIDDYKARREDRGYFMAGIRCTVKKDCTISEVKQGKWGLIDIPDNAVYRVYRWVGSYGGLTEYYRAIFEHIFNAQRSECLNIASPLFEQYENSPANNTPEEQLITDIWVPICHHPSHRKGRQTPKP